MSHVVLSRAAHIRLLGIHEEKIQRRLEQTRVAKGVEKPQPFGKDQGAPDLTG